MWKGVFTNRKVEIKEFLNLDQKFKTELIDRFITTYDAHDENVKIARPLCQKALLGKGLDQGSIPDLLKNLDKENKLTVGQKASLRESFIQFAKTYAKAKLSKGNPQPEDLQNFVKPYYEKDNQGMLADRWRRVKKAFCKARKDDDRKNPEGGGGGGGGPSAP